ncbi:hypothetical protein C6Q05_30470, partial [Burkholderia multivorans]
MARARFRNRDVVDAQGVDRPERGTQHGFHGLSLLARRDRASIRASRGGGGGGPPPPPPPPAAPPRGRRADTGGPPPGARPGPRGPTPPAPPP